MPGQKEHRPKDQAPSPDSTDSRFMRDVLGTKSDASVTTVGVIASVVAYVKGLLNQVAAIITSTDEIPSETNAKTWNATALASIEAEATDAIEADNLDHLLMLDGATQKYPEQCETDSILAKILVKADPAIPSQFDNSTDSLEAIRDIIDTYNVADQADLDAILEDTGTTIPATITAVDKVVDNILAKGIGAGTIFYVDSAAADDTGDGLTAATAKKTIDAGVNLCTANNGDVVLIYASGGAAFDENANTGGVLMDTAGVTLLGVNKPLIANSNGGATAIISITATRCTIKGLYLNDTAIIGISIDGAGVDYNVIENNIIWGDMTSGIYMNDTDWNQIYGNHIAEMGTATRNGIKVSGSSRSNRFIDNWIDNTDYGIWINAGTQTQNLIWRNSIAGSSGGTAKGIYIDGAGAGHTEIKDNNITDCTLAIDDSGTSTDIAGNHTGGSNIPDGKAIYDVTGAFSGDGGAAQDDSVKASLDLAHTDLDTIITNVGTVDTVVDGIQTDLDNATDGLGALKTLIDANQVDLDAIIAGVITNAAGADVATDVVAMQADIDHATYGLSAIQVQVDDIQDKVDGTDATAVALRREYGRNQVMEFSVTAAANAGVTTVATITTQPCLIKRVVIHADAGQTLDMTSCALKGGTAQSVELIAAGVAIQASLDATDKQVSASGAWRLAATKTIDIDLQGTGATAVDLTITIEYEACVDGGYLA